MRSSSAVNWTHIWIQVATFILFCSCFVSWTRASTCDLSVTGGLLSTGSTEEAADINLSDFSQEVKPSELGDFYTAGWDQMTLALRVQEIFRERGVVQGSYIGNIQEIRDITHRAIAYIRESIITQGTDFRLHPNAQEIPERKLRDILVDEEGRLDTPENIQLRLSQLNRIGKEALRSLNTKTGARRMTYRRFFVFCIQLAIVATPARRLPSTFGSQYSAVWYETDAWLTYSSFIQKIGGGVGEVREFMYDNFPENIAMPVIGGNLGFATLNFSFMSGVSLIGLNGLPQVVEGRVWWPLDFIVHDLAHMKFYMDAWKDKVTNKLKRFTAFFHRMLNDETVEHQKIIHLLYFLYSHERPSFYGRLLESRLTRQGDTVPLPHKPDIVFWGVDPNNYDAVAEFYRRSYQLSDEFVGRVREASGYTIP